MRPAAAALAFALASLAGCSQSPCQDLGEKLCACTGATSDVCETQVEGQLDTVDLTEGRCEDLLATCRAPSGAEFCEWLLTATGKQSCGLAPPPAP